MKLLVKWFIHARRTVGPPVSDSFSICTGTLKRNDKNSRPGNFEMSIILVSPTNELMMIAVRQFGLHHCSIVPHDGHLGVSKSGCIRISGRWFPLATAQRNVLFARCPMHYVFIVLRACVLSPHARLDPIVRDDGALGLLAWGSDCVYKASKCQPRSCY